MKKVRILNPKAGHGEAVLLEKEDEIESYTTTAVGDAERFAYERCLSEPETHFIVCGGDGTVNEVVNGIMRAGAGKTAMFSVVPVGSGNDYIKNDLEKLTPHWVDLIKVNGTYCVNMLNMGFDCSVAYNTIGFKQKHKGSSAYILGVGKSVLSHLGHDLKLTLTLEDGTTEEIERELLICAAANGKYCGGGFKAAPLADLKDGLIDVLMIDKIHRIRFVTLFGDYRSGKFIDEDGNVKKNYASIIRYRKCRAVTITGMSRYCNDGEIIEADRVDISVEPSCIRFLP